MSKEIILTREEVTKVDDILYNHLNKWKWHCTSNRYAMRSEMTNGVQHGILMHRYIMNAQEGEEVDHINHDTLDNRKENLRLCTKNENQHNKNKQKEKATSKYKGVSINPQNNLFEVSIYNNNERIFIGYFTNEEAGANAYNDYAIKIHKDFACLNEVEKIEDWEKYKTNITKTSKYHGVYKKCGKWTATIYYKDENNKKCRFQTKYFNSEEEAAKEYNKYVDIYLKDKGKRNII